jgi:hypothetical protein
MELLSLLESAAELVSDRSLRELATTLWSVSRPFTNSASHAAARQVAALLREWNVHSQTFELPADGKSTRGEYKAPLAWDCSDARLEIWEPFEERGKVLADFRKQPCHVLKWSGPTQPQGLTAEVVRLPSDNDKPPVLDSVRNRIVYTAGDPRPLKKRLCEAGALAVVTSFSPQARHLPNECAFLDSWPDEPDGWGFHDGDAPLPCVVVSPETGVELDVLLDRGRVRLRLKVDSKYQEGSFPVACGYLDGTMQKEILLLAPAFGPCANGHAAGGAVVLETLRVVQQLLADGRLPETRRSVRGLLAPAGHGALAFALDNPGILRRMSAAVSWEAVGRVHESHQAVFHFLRVPDAAASAAEVLLALLLETWLPRALPYARLLPAEPYAVAENVLSDPAFGVPCPAVLGRDRLHFTSGDGPESLDGAALHAFATISVAYTHFLLRASTPEAFQLAQEVVRHYGRRMEDLASRYAARLAESGAEKPVVLARACDHLTYLREIEERAVFSVKRFLKREDRVSGHLALLKLLRHSRRLLDLEKRRLQELADCEPAQLAAVEGLEDVAELRPLRKFSGPATGEGLAAEERAMLVRPAWNAPLHAALCWSDGTKTFPEILRRVRYEFAADQPVEEALPESLSALANAFRVLGAHDRLQWLQPGEEAPKTAAEPAAESAAAGEAPEEGAETSEPETGATQEK